jgi:hypothetical protein
LFAPGREGRWITLQKSERGCKHAITGVHPSSNQEPGACTSKEVEAPAKMPWIGSRCDVLVQILCGGFDMETQLTPVQARHAPRSVSCFPVCLPTAIFPPEWSGRGRTSGKQQACAADEGAALSLTPLTHASDVYQRIQKSY